MGGTGVFDQLRSKTLDYETEKDKKNHKNLNKQKQKVRVSIVKQNSRAAIVRGNSLAAVEMSIDQLNLEVLTMTGLYLNRSPDSVDIPEPIWSSVLIHTPTVK